MMNRNLLPLRDALRCTLISAPSKIQIFSVKAPYRTVLKSLLTIFLMLCSLGVSGQTTIFSENIGTPSGTTLIPAYSTGTAPATFQNKGTLSYSGDSDVRTSSPSSAYTGASANGNVFITNASNRYFTIYGINSSGYTGLSLSFGLLKSTAVTTPLTSVQFIVEVATDYNSTTNTGTFTALNFPTITTGATWSLITPTGTIPASSTLAIRFRQNQTTAQVRIDDVKLIGTAPTGKTSNCSVCSWNDPNAWLPVGVPTATDNVTIRATDIIYSNNAALLRTAATYVNGSFQIENGFSIDNASTNFNYGPAGTLIFKTTGPYGVSSNDEYWPYTNGPVNVRVLQGGFTLNSGVTRIVTGNLETAAGISMAVGENLTINGTATINTAGFFSSTPTFGPTSTLEYKNQGGYNVGNEWTGNATAPGLGVPKNVNLVSATINIPNFSHGLAGNLNIDSNSTLNLNSSSGDLFIAGNWTKAGTFSPNSRAVFFNGTTAQTITGPTTFDYLTINNTAGVTLASSITNNYSLDFINGKLTLGTNDLTIGPGGTIANAAAAKYVVTNSTGQLKRTVGNGSVLFPVGNAAYNPITFNNSGTSDLYGVRVVDAAPAGANPAKTVNRQWVTTEDVAGGSNLSVMAQYNIAEIGNGFAAANNPFIGIYNGTSYSQQVAANVTTSDPATATSTTNLTPTDLTTGTKYFAIGKDNGLVSVPTKFVISNITPASPVAGSGFSATVTAQDAYNSASLISSASSFNLTTNGNAGAIAGTTSGTIAAGNNSVVVSGIILPNPGTSVTLTATNSSGLTLASGTSAPFTVLGVATKLKFVSVPGTGTVGSNLASFKVEAQRADNSVDTNFTGSVTITKTTGPGNILGTLTKTAVAGVATFNDIQFDAPGTYTITTTSGSLASDTSGNIVIAPNPANAFFRSNATVGNWNVPGNWESSNDGITWNNATLFPTSAANTVTIRNENTITIASDVTLDQLIIEDKGTLSVNVNSGKLNINDGVGIDIDIKSGGVLQVFSTASASNISYSEKIKFISSASMNVSGKIVVGNGNNFMGGRYGEFGYASAAQIIWNNSAVLEWNTGGSSPEVSGKVYFPDVPSTTVPVFRITKSNAGFNGDSNLIVNGIFQLSGTDVTFAQNGLRTFRNGIVCFGTCKMSISGVSGAWQIGDGTEPVSAELGGSTGNLTLTNSNGITLLNKSSTTLTSTIKMGISTKFTVETGAVLNFGFDSSGNALNLERAGVANLTAFEAKSGSTLKITSPAGISNVAGDYTGNVQVGSTAENRIFSPDATFHYIGKANAAQVSLNGVDQISGNGLPSGASDKNIIIDLDTTNPAQDNVSFKAIGIYKFTSAGLLKIIKGKVIDEIGNGFADGAFADGNLTMTGGRYRISRAGLQPSLGGIYDLTGGVIELATSSTGIQIRTGALSNLKEYYKIEASGMNIEPSGKNLLVNHTTTVTNTGILTIPASPDNSSPNVVTSKRGVTILGNGILSLENNAQLMQDEDAVNTGNITARRTATIPISTFNQYAYWSSPVNSQNFRDIFPAYPTTALYYNESNDKFYTSSGVYIAGRGLAVRNPIIATGTATNLSALFTGVPFVGNLPYNLAFTDSSHGYNLVGNPYPSNLDLDLLYSNSTDIESTFRFWDNTSNVQQSQLGSGYQGYSYAIYNAASGTGLPSPGTGVGATNNVGKVPNNIVKVGQGFLTRAKTNVAKLNFKNDQRITAQTKAQFFGKNSADSIRDRYLIELVTPANLVISNAVVYFGNGNNDLAADDSKLVSGMSDALFTNAGDEKVVINGRNTFQDNDVLEVGNRYFADGVYQIRLGTTEGTFANGQHIYLKDKQTGTVTDLSEGNYTFMANAGVSTGRFEIIYRPETVLATDGNNVENLVVYRDGNNFVVKATDAKIDAIDIYDAVGRLIRRLEPRSTTALIDASTFVNGSYILKIDQGNLSTVKKILK
ncbi:CHU large protein; uncharacterized [Flavobacteriaceae bacterium 3519-10]|nr:CHU large protein; uncharacterized [Flavobacteriaceae bacterium 3519-10]